MSAETLDRAIAEFRLLRETPGGPGPRYTELLGRLDAFYWQRVEEVVSDALAKADEELAFKAAEALLLNAGLLDVGLVARAGREFLERLSAELRARGEENILYLDEWLSRRYRSFLATRTLPDERVSASALLRAAAAEDAELGKSRAQRNELYRRLARLFEDLPGIGADLAGAITRGAVDDRIEELLLAESLDRAAAGRGRDDGQDAGSRQARGYDQTVLRVLQLARERAEDDDDLLYLETIAKLRMAIFRKSLARARRAQARRAAAPEVPAASRPAPEATLGEARRFMRRELRLIRSLLRIGSQEGKVAQACSVLLYDSQRTTKAAAGAVLDLVREVDPRLGLTRDLLIAPFTGSGFFEWDRNTLVVALTPARGVEEAVVNAVANFRLLIDARQGSGRLAAAYRAAHGPNFRKQFLSDYHAWVLRAGHGRTEGLGDKTFQFFAENIGPAAAGPVVPAEMARLSVRQREEEAARLEPLVRRGRPGFPELYRLAVLLWQAEHIDQAIRLMERAAGLRPDNGRVLYSLGVLCRRRHLLGAARRAFRQCVQAAANTLWGVYAHEALRRLV